MCSTADVGCRWTGHGTNKASACSDTMRRRRASDQYPVHALSKHTRHMSKLLPARQAACRCLRGGRGRRAAAIARPTLRPTTRRCCGPSPASAAGTTNHACRSGRRGTRTRRTARRRRARRRRRTMRAPRRLVRATGRLATLRRGGFHAAPRVPEEEEEEDGGGAPAQREGQAHAHARSAGWLPLRRDLPTGGRVEVAVAVAVAVAAAPVAAAGDAATEKRKKADRDAQRAKAQKEAAARVAKIRWRQGRRICDKRKQYRSWPRSPCPALRRRDPAAGTKSKAPAARHLRFTGGGGGGRRRRARPASRSRTPRRPRRRRRAGTTPTPSSRRSWQQIPPHFRVVLLGPHRVLPQRLLDQQEDGEDLSARGLSAAHGQRAVPSPILSAWANALKEAVVSVDEKTGTKASRA